MEAGGLYVKDKFGPTKQVLRKTDIRVNVPKEYSILPFVNLD